ESNLPFPFEILDLAYAVPGDQEKGEPEISTLVQLIGNQLSPFYAALVQSNVALAIEAEQDTQLHGGLFNVFIVINPGHSSAEAQQIFQATMDTVLKSGFGPDLVQASKRLEIADRMYSGDSITGMGDLAGYTYGIVGERIANEDTRLQAITSQSLLDVTQTYLKTPTVVGILRTKTQPARSASQKSDASISDDFSKRVPNGPVTIPASIRTAVHTPTTARSTLHPTEFTLHNGLKVIVQEKHDRPTFMLTGQIQSSASFTPSGKEGIGRLASAAADYGSENYPFAARRRAIDMMGAEVHSGAEFTARGLVRDFQSIVGIVADGEEHPTFADPWFEIERGQLSNSLQSESTISGVMVDRAYARLLASPRDPSLRVPSAGTVSGITRQDLLAYVAQYWRPDLTTIAVVGDVTPEQVRSTLESAFGSWNASGTTPDARQLAYPAARSGHDYIGTQATQVYVRLGQPAVARSSSDYAAFLVMNQILGGSGAFESRLWQEMRQKRGLVYSVNSAVFAGRDRGDFRIEFNATPSRVPEAVRFVRSELRRLQTEPVTATELEEAKLRLVSNALLEEGSTEGEVSQLLDIGTNALPLKYYRTLNDRYTGITASDVQRVAKEYLVPDRLVEIFAGPPGPWAQDTI
ncbi:MAG: insulinase family protein, partial [Candidatus Eremiobacteraeota bacterium]|nr:insulinase family protein [Candidatus Eremiobacteraeota bacterium]